MQRVADIIRSEWWPDASDGALAQMGVEVEAAMTQMRSQREVTLAQMEVDVEARTEEDEVAPHAASEDILQMGPPEPPKR